MILNRKHLKRLVELGSGPDMHEDYREAAASVKQYLDATREIQRKMTLRWRTESGEGETEIQIAADSVTEATQMAIEYFASNFSGYELIGVSAS